MNGSLLDKDNKLILFWSGKAACTTAISLFFKNMGIFDEAIAFHPFSHVYRHYIFYKKYGQVNKKMLEDNSYYKLKIVRNPYYRVISSYFWLVENPYLDNNIELNNDDYPKISISFREFLLEMKKGIDPKHKQLINHSREQNNEFDIYIDKFIKIEKVEEELQEVDSIKNTNLYDSYMYIMNKNSNHVKLKNNDISYFVGDTKPYEYVSSKGYPDYQWFYNDEIRKLVEEIYANDISYYNYEYPF